MGVTFLHRFVRAVRAVLQYVGTLARYGHSITNGKIINNNIVDTIDTLL